MTFGFTETKVRSMFDSLRKEVFDYFDYARPLDFMIRPQDHPVLFRGSLAATSFGEEPENPWSPPQQYANAVLLNQQSVDWAYEDEMINILLHELTHVTAGITAQHGPEWQRQASEVGALPVTFMVLRNWEQAWEPFSNSWYEGQRAVAPTMDLYANMSL